MLISERLAADIPLMRHYICWTPDNINGVVQCSIACDVPNWVNNEKNDILGNIEIIVFSRDKR